METEKKHRPINEIMADIEKCGKEFDAYHDELDAVVSCYENNGFDEQIVRARKALSEMRVSWHDANRYKEHFHEFHEAMKELKA